MMDKEVIAVKLATVLEPIIGDPQIPLLAKAQFLCGLMTRVEIEELLLRDEIRREITRQIREEQRLCIRDVAKSTKASRETVSRVWTAMGYEYPMDTSTSANFCIAIPKEARAFQPVQEILLEFGFRIDIPNDRTRTGFVIDIQNGLEKIPCQLIAGPDIIKYMRTGAFELGFLGNDQIFEFEAENELGSRRRTSLKIWETFRENSFRMCLAVPKEAAVEAAGTGLEFFRGKKLATTFEKTLRYYLQRNGVEPGEIIPLKGGVEAALKSFGATGIMDITETGNSLASNNLIVFGEPVYKGNISLFSLQDAIIPNEDLLRINPFINRLRAEKTRAQTLAA